MGCIEWFKLSSVVNGIYSIHVGLDLICGKYYISYLWTYYPLTENKGGF